MGVKKKSWLRENSVLSRAKEAGHQHVIKLLEEHFKKYPNGIKTASTTSESDSPTVSSKLFDKKPAPTLRQYNENKAASLMDKTVKKLSISPILKQKGLLTLAQFNRSRSLALEELRAQANVSSVMKPMVIHVAN